MKNLIFLSLFIASNFYCYSQATNNQIRNAKMGRLVVDQSPIYHLPYLNGKKYLLAQGYNSSFSHKNELSLDFKMKQGSKICAARNGIVVDFIDSNTKGGLNEKYLAFGNYIIIEHTDKSKAMYWHLQYKGVKVKIGENVFDGQFIGLSGNTVTLLFLIYIFKYKMLMAMIY